MGNVVGVWSYYSWVVKVPNISGLDKTMNLLGADGWELVTSLTTVKSWVNVTGNDLVFVFKKQGAGQRPSSNVLNRIAGVAADAPAY